MIKSFIEFMNEGLSYINMGSSQRIKGDKRIILKRSKKQYYSDDEIEIVEMMKRRPDLFCEVFKVSKELISMRKLDCERFLKDIEREFNKEQNGLPEVLKLAYEDSGLADVSFILNIERYHIERNVVSKLLKSYFLLLYDICSYFKYYSKGDIDLHTGNFGYIKGTKQIRCFDPIHINRVNEIEFIDPNEYEQEPFYYH